MERWATGATPGHSWNALDVAIAEGVLIISSRPSRTVRRSLNDHASIIFPPTEIESSPSGVAGIAAMMAANSAVMDAFGLSPDSRCLAIISEGPA